MDQSIIKHDLKTKIQTSSYYAEAEFFRLMQDNSIPHEKRIELMEAQINIITNAFNALKLVDAFIPDRQPAQETPTE